MSLESFNVDVCCPSDTCIQDSSTVLRIGTPSATSQTLFYLRLSGNPVATSSRFAGVALSTSDEAALIYWISINWVSTSSLHLIASRRSIAGDREFDHKQRLLPNKIV
ncbi:unnamed protein product, partial [Schistosoma bovis]